MRACSNRTLPTAASARTHTSRATPPQTSPSGSESHSETHSKTPCFRSDTRSQNLLLNRTEQLGNLNVEIDAIKTFCIRQDNQHDELLELRQNLNLLKLENTPLFPPQGKKLVR